MNIPVHAQPEAIEIVDIYHDNDETEAMRQELDDTIKQLNAVQSRPNPDYEKYLYTVEQLQDHASYLEMRINESV